KSLMVRTILRSRFTRVLCFLVFAMILNSLLGYCVPIASANQIVLTKIAQIETGDAYDVWVDTSRNITYVTCGYSGVKAFDVSDPGNPIEIATVSSSLDYYAHQLVMRNNLMFIGDGRGGLKIIDFGNISSPIVLSQYTGDYAWDVEVRGDTAFVANGFQGVGDRLTIVNVSDPTSPELLGSHTIAGDATDIEIVENLAFVTTSYAGFTVFDVSNHTNPIQLTQYVGPSTSDADLGDLEIIGELAFLSYWGKSFKILNISNLSNIEIIAEYNETLDSFSVHIDTDRNLAFLCDLELGLLLLDIQNPTQITEVTRYFDGGKPNRIDVVGNLIYMTDQENGFVILEIGESGGPSIGLEPLLIIGGLAAIVVIYCLLKKVRTPS
ncbi:MAG: LVIVD repeat-containing protein, partial [Candidatus Thorarchaeota archaeon]